MSLIRVWLGLVAVAVALGIAAWASDFLTLQGERTVFTVECSAGVWAGDRCSGKLVSGPRYRYRALKAHSEVIFWIVGGVEPSAKFSACVIQDGRNWRCQPNADASRSITLEMVQGVPVAGPPALTRSFHMVSKWRWYLLEHGIASG